jgi:hypothetical protein
MYRRFLSGDRVKIRLAAFNIDPLFSTITIDRCAQPNDPCYLMVDTSCPAPYGKEPLFNKWAVDILPSLKAWGFPNIAIWVSASKHQPSETYSLRVLQLLHRLKRLAQPPKYYLPHSHLCHG